MDLNALMRQAQKMKNDLEKTQKELESTVYEGSSNGIVIKVNGKCEAQEVNIPEELMDDREMLQDMILIAFNEAVANVEKDREDKLGAATNGLNIPGM